MDNDKFIRSLSLSGSNRIPIAIEKRKIYLSIPQRLAYSRFNTNFQLTWMTCGNLNNGLTHLYQTAIIIISTQSRT